MDDNKKEPSKIQSILDDMINRYLELLDESCKQNNITTAMMCLGYATYFLESSDSKDIHREKWTKVRTKAFDVLNQLMIKSREEIQKKMEENNNDDTRRETSTLQQETNGETKGEKV